MTQQVDECDLRLRLDWVQQRLDALDAIERGLVEMREMAAQAQDEAMDKAARDAISLRMQSLQRSLYVLDEQTRTFWLDRQ